jgi:hypothetical protein
VDRALPRQIDNDLMMAQALAALDEAEIADEAVIAATHAGEPRSPELIAHARKHSHSMHSRLIPSNLDVAESSRPIAIACPGEPKEMLMSVEGNKGGAGTLPDVDGARSCEQPTLFQLSFLLTISNSLTKDQLPCVRFFLFLCLF